MPEELDMDQAQTLNFTCDGVWVNNSCWDF